METNLSDRSPCAASWLPGDLLVVVGSPGLPPELDGERARRFAFTAGDRDRELSFFCCSDPEPRRHLETVFHPCITEWQTLLREHFAPLDPETREQIVSFLATALNGDCCPREAVRGLSRSLHAAREALRERLPVFASSQRQPRGLSVDALIALDERSFYVRGSFHDEESAVRRLTVVSPEGARVELLDNLFRFERRAFSTIYNSSADETDGRFGFVRYFELPSPSYFPTGWLFEMESASGEALEIAAPVPISDPVETRDAIFADLALEPPSRDELLARQIHPAISRLQARRHASIAAQSVDQYGTPPASAKTTIIVPLYGRIDFLEHQLAQFVHDPEIRETADLIYVLDSPELAGTLATQAAGLARLYGVPFRIVTLNRNGGYSAANNIGASLARGRRLLLLNSDVLPDRPGWLGVMNRFYDATAHIGALGPKLLFEDDSLQHAGLYFSPMLDGSGWENQHFFKGLQRNLPAANIARPVPAVTAACLLIDRALYEKLGGLRGMYVQGDYEDSDLCLRLAEDGRENWYLPEVELYHLEGQSYPAPLRALTSRYNRWLHTHTWAAQIANSRLRSSTTYEHSSASA